MLWVRHWCCGLILLPRKVDPKLAETTWVHKIFGGKLRSRVNCGECGHNSDTFDSILDLSVDIHGVDTLRGALRQFTATDSLKGADKYKCEKYAFIDPLASSPKCSHYTRCKMHVDASKRFTIHDAPEVLTIHLKRFSPLGRKIGHAVQYDERLSLTNAVSEGQYGPSYLLYGVISHAGGGPNSGHYYAHVKASNDLWYEMNDDSVTRHPRSPTSMKNAYMLFYMREGGQGLQAAVTSVSRLPPLSPNSVKNKVKKDPDTAVEETERRPFIGPLLPSTSKTTPSVIPVRDPQADFLKKKIQAVSKPTPLKPSNALLSLSQYTDDDDDDDDAEDIGEKVETPTPVQPEETTPPPPSSSTSSSIPSIPPSQFYSSSPSTRPHGVKRKSPDNDDRPLQRSPKTRWHSTHSSKHRFLASGPFSHARTSSVKNSMQGRFGKKKPII